MKSKIFFIAVVLFLLTFQNSYSQSKSEKVKTRLVELFGLVKDNKYSEAAAYFVYRGVDTARKWNDYCKYDTDEEKLAVDRACKEIKNMITDGGDYEFVKFQTETESEGQWCIWELKFENKPDKKIYFAFLKIKGKYCLGDID